MECEYDPCGATCRCTYQCDPAPPLILDQRYFSRDAIDHGVIALNWWRTTITNTPPHFHCVPIEPLHRKRESSRLSGIAVFEYGRLKITRFVTLAPRLLYLWGGPENWPCITGVCACHPHPFLPKVDGAEQKPGMSI